MIPRLRRARFLPGLLLGALILVLVPLAGAAKSPVVVVTIGPLRELVGAVMQGVGKPIALIPADQAPETFALHDKDLDTLRQADLVFWIGPSLEAELARPLADLEIGAHIINLSESPGLLVYPIRHGGEWEPPPAGRHLPDSVGGLGAPDGHIWLDADNAKLLIGRIAMTLTDVDFGNAETYRINAARLRKSLDGLDQEIAAQLAPLRGQPFLLLQDDFQYWEVRYGLAAEGSVSLEPGALNSEELKRVAAKAGRLQARCVIGDSTSEEAQLRQVATATQVRTAIVDLYHDGTGAEAFLEMMRETADGFARCLGGGGENLSQRP